jgi:trans-aconitate methyltransferase
VSDPRAAVAAYYASKLAEHGSTPRGVDWNGADSQLLRFRQLLRITDDAEGPFSLLDYGCGYAALLDTLRDQSAAVDYTGFDIAREMVAAARERHPGARFITDDSALRPVDYVVASGIFNVRLDHDPTAWETYIVETLDRMRALSVRGIAFNMLTSYSDPEHMRADLHYADPRDVFDHCKRRLSRKVALLHDYGLYEFTVLVRFDG